MIMQIKYNFISLPLFFVGILSFVFVPSSSFAQNRQRGIRVEAKEKPKPVMTSQRVALVIGNATYPVAPLKNPVNDAKAISQSLQELGFEVTSLENLSLNDMKRAIRAFGEKTRTASVRLFYYAGHGMQVNGENYLLPVDTTINKEEEVEYVAVNAGFVLAQMENINDSLNIVILDACRNNPFARSSRSATRGLATINAPTGTLVAYATAPGSVAADGEGSNGLYTQELLKSIKTSGLSVEEIFKQVRINVRGRSQGKQVPWESSSLTGEFYFNRAAAGSNKVSPIQAEVAFWESIKSSSKLADYQTYLERYPDGMFVDVAKSRSMNLSLPSVDELLNNYLKSIGGATAINQINTVVKKGTFVVEYGQQKIQGVIEEYEKRPGKILSINKVGNDISKEVYNGNTGWLYASKTGTQEAPVINITTQRRALAWTYADIEQLKQLYSKIIIKRKENLDNQEFIVVEAVPLEGKTETLYFNAQTMELYRWDFFVGSASMQSGVTVPVQVFLEGYVDIGGVKVPLLVRQVSGGATRINKFQLWEVKYNVPLDDKLFAKPTK